MNRGALWLAGAVSVAGAAEVPKPSSSEESALESREGMSFGSSPLDEAEGMANESGEPPGYEYLRGIAGRDFCARNDPDWPQQKTECQAGGGTWIEVYEGIGRPAGWFEDPYLPGWCVTAEELEKATPAEQETEPASVESGTAQTEPSVPPRATEPEPSTALPATQPTQAQQGSPQYTG